MKRLHKYIAAAAVVFILLGAAAYALWQPPVWPDFPAQADRNPQVITHVDRDYGHRTGDLIEVDIYFHLHSGTRLDTESLVVEEDFELAEPPQFAERKLADGSVVERMRLHVQSFRVSQKVTLNATVAWFDGQTRTRLVLPGVDLYTSKTYDGRENLQEGRDPRQPFLAYAWTYVAALSASLLLYAVLLALAVRKYFRSRPVPQVDAARERALVLMARLRDSRCSKDDHLELDGLVREHFGIGPVPAARLDTKTVPAELVQFLQMNAPAIYSPENLDNEKRQQLGQLGDRLMLRWQ